MNKAYRKFIAFCQSFFSAARKVSKETEQAKQATKESLSVISQAELVLSQLRAGAAEKALANAARLDQDLNALSAEDRAAEESFLAELKAERDSTDKTIADLERAITAARTKLTEKVTELSTQRADEKKVTDDVAAAAKSEAAAQRQLAAELSGSDEQ